MKCRFLLDVVVAQSAAIFKLLSSEDKSLLVWRDTLLVLDLGFDVFDGVGCLDFQSDCLASESLHENLHTSPKTQHQMECGLLLDVVVGKSTSIFKLFSGENESLLVWGDTLLVLDFSLDVFDRIGCFYLKCDGLSGQGFDENLHSSSQTKYEMKSRLLLDVVVAQSAAVLELFPSEDKSLLVWGDTLLVLDLGLDVFDSVRGLDFQSDGLSGKRLDKDLHTSTKAENQVKSRLLLNVVVAQSAAVFKLLSSEDKSLLVWGDTLLVLDFSLDVFDSVGSLDLESDGLSGKRLDEDLHFGCCLVER